MAGNLETDRQAFNAFLGDIPGFEKLETQKRDKEAFNAFLAGIPALDDFREAVLVPDSPWEKIADHLKGQYNLRPVLGDRLQPELILRTKDGCDSKRKADLLRRATDMLMRGRHLREAEVGLDLNRSTCGIWPVVNTFYKEDGAEDIQNSLIIFKFREVKNESFLECLRRIVEMANQLNPVFPAVDFTYDPTKI